MVRINVSTHLVAATGEEIIGDPGQGCDWAFVRFAQESVHPTVHVEHGHCTCPCSNRQPPLSACLDRILLSNHAIRERRECECPRVRERCPPQCPTPPHNGEGNTAAAAAKPSRCKVHGKRDGWAGGSGGRWKLTHAMQHAGSERSAGLVATTVPLAVSHTYAHKSIHVSDRTPVTVAHHAHISVRQPMQHGHSEHVCECVCVSECVRLWQQGKRSLSSRVFQTAAV